MAWAAVGDNSRCSGCDDGPVLELVDDRVDVDQVDLDVDRAGPHLTTLDVEGVDGVDVSMEAVLDMMPSRTPPTGRPRGDRHAGLASALPRPGNCFRPFYRGRSAPEGR